MITIPAFEMSPGLSESECRSVEDNQSRTENSLEDEKEDVVEDVVDSPPPSGYEIKTDSESGEKYYVNIFTGFNFNYFLQKDSCWRYLILINRNLVPLWKRHCISWYYSVLKGQMIYLFGGEGGGRDFPPTLLCKVDAID